VAPVWCKRRWRLPHSRWQIFRHYLNVLQIISNAISLIEREGANKFSKPVYVSIVESSMEYDQRVIVRFLRNEGVQSDQIHTRLKAQFEDDTYNLPRVQYWWQYVRQGWEDLHNEKWSSRPSFKFIDSKIIACLDRELFHLAYSIAEVIGVWYLIVLRHLRDSLGMKNFYLRWILHRLTNDLRQWCVAVCKELFPMLEI
jgi:hypothetical protein